MATIILEYKKMKYLEYKKMKYLEYKKMKYYDNDTMGPPDPNTYELCIVVYNKYYCDRRCAYHRKSRNCFGDLDLCTKKIPEVILAGDDVCQNRTGLCLEYYS